MKDQLMKEQLIVILLLYLVFFFYIRGFLSSEILYQLNNSAYKKRKKGQTFIEWLFYSRFRGEIPKILLVLYYSVLIIHPAGAIACLLVHITMGLNIGRIILTGIFAFDSIWTFAIHFLFWQNRPGWAFERWITKKRGQRKRRK